MRDKGEGRRQKGDIGRSIIDGWMDSSIHPSTHESIHVFIDGSMYGSWMDRSIDRSIIDGWMDSSIHPVIRPYIRSHRSERVQEVSLERATRKIFLFICVF